jgi:hypothetical protein
MLAEEAPVRATKRSNRFSSFNGREQFVYSLNNYVRKFRQFVSTIEIARLKLDAIRTMSREVFETFDETSR